MAEATRTLGRWVVEAPQPVGPAEAFVDRLFAGLQPVLAGFDFPIGLPLAYGARTGFADFLDALDRLGPAFFTPAATPAEIGLSRPFYPARPGGARRQHLVDGHAVADMAALTRRCERGSAGFKPAGSLFWTLGASQVGKAALHGWSAVVRPARARGARLWPFEGGLDGLAGQGGVTLLETYPADAYAKVGARFAPGESKRRQADRAAKAPALEAWAKRRAVEISPDLLAALRAGFGPEDRGGDRFDAALGLLAMIDHEAEGWPEPPPHEPIRRWEGWILGRPA